MGPAVAAAAQTPGVQGSGADPLPLRLADAWVRAMPPGRRMTAAYLRIANDGPSPLRLDGVSASQGSASLHETRIVDGQSRMREVGAIEVPAGGEIALAPGGLHIMLMGLEAVPAEGEVLRLCVHAADAKACVDAVVRRTAPGGDDRRDRAVSDYRQEGPA